MLALNFQERSSTPGTGPGDPARQGVTALQIVAIRAVRDGAQAAVFALRRAGVADPAVSPLEVALTPAERDIVARTRRQVPSGLMTSARPRERAAPTVRCDSRSNEVD